VVRKEIGEREMTKKKNWWGKSKMWKKGAIVAGAVAAVWTFVGACINLYITSTGSVPSKLIFCFDAFPVYSLAVPLGIAEWGQRLAPPGLTEFVYLIPVTIMWMAIGGIVTYIYTYAQK